MNHLCRLLAVAMLFSSSTMSTQKLSSNNFAFTNVAIVDVVSGRAIPDMALIVSDGRITAMGKSGTLRAPANAPVINASGKFLIPGLWDMHVHWYDESTTYSHGKDYLPLFLANGVTGMRVMIGLPVHQEWRKSIDNGSMLGPRLIIASRLFDGANPAPAKKLNRRA